MSVISRSQAQALADAIAAETALHALTPEIIGGFLRDITDTVVFPGDAETPPTAGNGLTGTNVFSVLPNGTSLDVSASGVRLSDIPGLSVLARSSSSAGIPAAVTGVDGQVFRVAGSSLGFGTIATAGIGDGQVTLPKLASIATDSLLGRDTGGTGAVENITLNATLSMTGVGVLQRAALTGAISAAAGSNTTAFASADFSALDIATTGTVRIGSTPATAGDLRTKNAFVMESRNSVNTGNAVLMQFTAGDSFVLGDSLYPTILNGLGALSLRSANNVCATLNTSALTLYVPAITFLQSVASPVISQANETANSVNGDTLTIRAQNSTGTTTTGGGLDVGPGSGTTAGGLGRLLSGSLAARYSWSDTGHAFFAAAVAAQVADMGALTDSTGGTANGTLVDVGGAFSQSTLNDNFADLAAKVTSIRNCLRTVGLMA